MDRYSFDVGRSHPFPHAGSSRRFPHVHQPPHPELLARQRQHTAQRRAATRVAELGFESVRAYLVDRLVTHAWTLEEVAGELGAAPTTLRRLLEEHQVRRVGPTRRQRVVAGRGLGPRAQAHVAQQRRQARLMELGFAGADEYLQDRTWGGAGRCGGWAPSSGAGHGWLDQRLVRLGLRP